MLILIKDLEELISRYETRINRGGLPKEELAIQRDFLRGSKLDLRRRKEQYKRASLVLIRSKIEEL